MKNKTIFFLVLSLAAFFFFFHLGDRSFRNPDEGRYAEIARNMVTSGDWIKPQLYGVDYLRKPILFYWLVALSFKLFGFNETAARLVPAFFGFLSVGITFLFAKRTMGQRTAVFTALLLMTNFWFLQVGRYLLIDMVFTFFITAALFSFFLATLEESERNLYYVFFYISAGLAFLTKGMAGLVIPALAILLYMAAVRRTWGFFRPIRLFAGFAIFLAIVGPWFVLIAIREPKFLEFFFIHEHFKRFASSQFEHQESWYFYLWVIPAIFMPWTVIWHPLKRATGLIRQKMRENAFFFSVLSSAGILVFYSLSKTKLPTYILPAIPLLCLVLGRVWRDWSDESVSKNTVWPVIGPVTILIFLAVGFLVASTQIFALAEGRFNPDTAVYFRIMAGVAVAGSVAAIRALRRGRRDLFFYMLTLTTGSLSLVFSYVMDVVNQDYTTRYFAETLSPRLKSSDQVFIYDHPGPFYDFRFYLKKPVKLVGLAGELELADKSDPDGKKAWVTRDEFWKSVEQHKSLYCLMRRSDYEGLSREQRNKTSVVFQDKRKVLFGAGIGTQ